MATPFADRYHTLPDPPAEFGAATVLARLLDGLGFRYRWAADGLAPTDLAFTPGHGSMTVGELLLHMRQLVCWVGVNVNASREGGDPVRWSDACAHLPDPGADPQALSEQVLQAIAQLREQLLDMGDERLADVRLLASSGPDLRPLWNAINGPLADFLTHVGQLNAWRRQMGKPAPRVDVFRGRPLED